MTKSINPMNFLAAILVAAVLAAPAAPTPGRGTDSVDLDTAAHTPTAAAEQGAALRGGQVMNVYDGLSTVTNGYSTEVFLGAAGNPNLRIKKDGTSICAARDTLGCGSGGRSYIPNLDGLTVVETRQSCGSTCSNMGHYGVCRDYVTSCTSSTAATKYPWQ